MARTRALDYAVKEDIILATAARLFSAEGVDRTSVAMIAAECGYSKALFYHYYDSKEELLFDIVSRHVTLLIAVVTDAGNAEITAEAKLGAMVKALLGAYGENEDQHRIQLAGLDSLSAARKDEVAILERDLVNRFADIIAILFTEKKRSAELLKPVTMSLFGMLNWHYMWFREQGPMSRDEYAALATQLIIHGAQEL